MYLTLPDDYNIPQRVSSLKPSDLVILIELGEKVYYDCKENFTKESIEQQLKNKYDVYKSELETNHMCNLRMEASKTQMFMQQAQEQKLHYEKELSDLKESYQRSSENIISENQAYRHQVNELQSKLYSYTSESQNALFSKIESLLGYGNSTDNIEKGNFGENYVKDKIIELYPESSVEDVSKLTAAGDLLWELQNKVNLKCIVEVKNVSCARNLNVEKFVRDVVVNSEKIQVNCGLFVSLKTENIHHKGKFKLEFVNSVPVLYVANVFKYPQVLNYALYFIKEIQNFMLDHYSTEQSDEHMDVLKQSFCNYFNDVKEEYESLLNCCEEIHKNIERTSNSAAKMHKTIECVMKKHVNMMKSHEFLHYYEEPKREVPEPDTTQKSESVSKEQCVSKIVEYYKEHSKYPSGDESGITRHYRNKYGYRAMLDEAMKQLENS